jgi:putative addiction module component (TIGR02574 family)
MNKHLTPGEIRQLPITERLRLIEEIWDSLDSEKENLPLPEWHKAELDRRIAAYDANPESARSWVDVKADILNKLSK